MNKLIVFLIASLFIFSMGGCSTAPVQSSASLIGSGLFISASGESILAEYRDNETVTLTLAHGETKTLTQAISGSGARYVLGTEEWWEHHGEATLSQDGSVIFSGKLTPLPEPGSSLEQSVTEPGVCPCQRPKDSDGMP